MDIGRILVGLPSQLFVPHHGAKSQPTRAISSEIDPQIELNVSPRITVLVLPERGRVIDVRIQGSPVNPVECVLEQRTKTNPRVFGNWEFLVNAKILLHVPAHSSVRQLADVAKREWSGC